MLSKFRRLNNKLSSFNSILSKNSFIIIQPLSTKKINNNTANIQQFKSNNNYSIRSFSTHQSLLLNTTTTNNNTTNNNNESSKEEIIINITESCAKRISELNNKKGDSSRMLRVIVDSGGCSGYQVEFTFSKELEQGDQIYFNPNFPDSKVVIDDLTMSFIKGSTIDFIESMAKTSFVLENNPNAEQGCSCGTSFNVKNKL
ncbi:hypothetical protein ABK040_005001 [Willaertia magna]